MQRQMKLGLLLLYFNIACKLVILDICIVKGGTVSLITIKCCNWEAGGLSGAY